MRALAERAPGSSALARYAEVARVLTGDPAAGVQDGVRWIRATVAALQVRPLAGLGLDPADGGAVADAALRASSMRGNPVRLTREEVLEILDRST